MSWKKISVTFPFNEIWSICFLTSFVIKFFSLNIHRKIKIFSNLQTLFPLHITLPTEVLNLVLQSKLQEMMMEIFSDGFSLLLSSSRSQAGIAISNANWAEAGDNHPGEKKKW